MLPTRILLLGKLPIVLAHALQTLRAAGFEAEGTTQLTTVHDDFDARNFTIVGLGGAFSDQQRAALTATFKAQNPTVHVLDLFAPVLLPQLTYLSSPAAEHPVVDHLATTATPAELRVEVHVRADCAATVTLYAYDGPDEVECLFDGLLPAGSTRLFVSRTPGIGFPHFLVVQTRQGEVQVHRFEH